MGEEVTLDTVEELATQYFLQGKLKGTQVKYQSHQIRLKLFAPWISRVIGEEALSICWNKAFQRKKDEALERFEILLRKVTQYNMDFFLFQTRKIYP